MTLEEREQIYSNDYFDIILEYNGDLQILENFRDFTTIIINLFLAIVYLPVSMINEESISRLGYAVFPNLFGLISDSSLESSGILRLRRIPDFDLRGRGVLIGFLDSGIDYTNPIFQNADGTTKILRLWDQSIMSEQSPAGIPYGTEYTREQINEALRSEDPYQLVPSTDEIGHGTMIAGIAAGNEVPESGFYGVAPDAEIVFVKLKRSKQNITSFFRIPEDAVSYQENDLMFAYQYLLNSAYELNRPLVICNAIDTSQYAHDGRGTTSGWLSLRATNIGVGVVCAVGNEGNARRHYAGTVDPVSGYDTVELYVGQPSEGFSMELWGASPNLFTLDITSPTGEFIPRIDVKLFETRQITFIFEPTVIYVNYTLVEAQSGDQLILLRFTNPSPGIWRFRVFGKGIDPLRFNIWLPMNNFIPPDTYFIRPDPYVTLLSVSTAPVPIAVTAYNDADDSLYMNAGRGFTRLGDVKPDIAAPGVNIVAPDLNHGFVEVSGTSAAAAHTAGVAAMLFEWGIVNGNYPDMNTQDMKVFMIRGARRDPNALYPNRDWGYGILDVYNIFDSLRTGV